MTIHSAATTVDDVLRNARNEGRDSLLEPEARVILDALGIPLPPQIFVTIEELSQEAVRKAVESLTGDRVVVKVVASDILHKTELGGVRFVARDVADVQSVIDAMRQSLAKYDLRGFLIAELLQYDRDPGSELLVGMRSTPDFGPVVTFGFGGVATEFMSANLRPGREIAVLSPETTDRSRIAAIISKNAVTPLATGGVRKQKAKVEIALLSDVLERLLDFAGKYIPSQIAEFEINPLVATNGRVVALDALVKLGGAEAAPMPERPLAKITNLLRPESAAVMGVSKGLNPGHVIVNNLIREGFDRKRIYIIKPGEDEIEGCRCVPDIASLPEAVDLLVLSISAEQVPDAVEQVVATRKAEGLIVIPGGMGEHAGSGNLEERMRDAIRRSRTTDWRGPVINGGNCLGITSRPGRYDTMFLPEHKLPKSTAKESPLAVISQSGAFAVAQASKLASMPPRYLVSIGNQVDLTVGDYLEYLADDPAIDVFAFYVEGFRPLDGVKWLKAAKRVVDSGRTVILYRAGRTAEGARASASHTAAIAGDAAVTRELATEAGVVVTESLDEFQDLMKLFTMLRGRKPAGRRLGAMSNAGFESVAFADSLGSLSFASFSEATTQRISEILKANKLEKIVTLANPLDTNPMMPDVPYGDSFAAIINDDNVDLGILGIVPLTGALTTLPKSDSHREDFENESSVVARAGAIWRQNRKPWVAVVDAGEMYDAMVRRLEELGIPAFRSADRALRMLSVWSDRQMGR